MWLGKPVHNENDHETNNKRHCKEVGQFESFERKLISYVLFYSNETTFSNRNKVRNELLMSSNVCVESVVVEIEINSHFIFGLSCEINGR